MIFKSSIFGLFCLVAGSTSAETAIHLLDGGFEVLGGKVVATDQGLVLEDATIRIQRGVLVSSELGLTDKKVRERNAEPLEYPLLIREVAKCWNVGSLSSEAMRTAIKVSFRVDQNNKPDVGSIRMIASSGGSDASARQAFEAARRAIIRCGASGYNLPKEKFAQWRDIEMTFNPEKMRNK
jgi:hypothetical protein